MSDSTAPGPPATRMRRGPLYFWLLIAIGSMWTEGTPLGTPGTELSDIQSIECPCPKCSGIADRQLDGTFRCPRGHTSRMQDGSIKCDDNKAS